MEKKINFISVLLVFILCLAGYQLLAPVIVKTFQKDKIVTSKEQLALYLDEELSQGNDTLTVYIQDMTEDELMNINQELDSFFGNVVSYQVKQKLTSDLQKVTFHLQVSDNYYVYMKYINGKEIPEDNLNAMKLYIIVCDVIDSVITENMTDYEKEVALHDYLIANCAYGYLEGEKEEASYTAYGALVERMAVCNGYAQAMELLLKCCDINAYMIVGTADGVAHAWNLVELDGNWYHLDATWNDPVPDTRGNVIHTYFNVSDAVMAESHTWKQEVYPACESMDYNYYMANGTYYKDFSEFRGAVINMIQYDKPDTISCMVGDYDEKMYEMNFIVNSGYVESVSWQTNGYGSTAELIIMLNYK